MLLPRIVPKGGRTIAGHFIPEGVEVAVSNRPMHHNATFWGSDHEEFRPERWTEEGADRLETGLMPFRCAFALDPGERELTWRSQVHRLPYLRRSVN